MKKILLLSLFFFSYIYAVECTYKKTTVLTQWNSKNVPSSYKIINPGWTPYKFAGVSSATSNDPLICSNIPTPTIPLIDRNENFSCVYDGNLSFNCLPVPENGYKDDDDGLVCNSGHSLTGVGMGIPACMPNPENGTYDDNDDLVCNAGFVIEGSSCVPSGDGGNNNPDNEGQNPDGSCQSGYFPTLDGGCIKGSTGGGDGGSTGGGDGGSTGGGDGGSTGGGDGGSTGGGSTGGGGTGGSTGGGTGTGGTGGTGGIDGETPESQNNGTGTNFMCEDGGRGIPLFSGSSEFHCDRTCEQVGLVTNPLTNKCYTNKECPEGQTKYGNDPFTGEPSCYAPSNDSNLNKSETLLSKIADNTSLNKNSNTALGNINQNTIRTNAKLEAVKGGLSQINTSITTGNTQLTQINSKLSDSDGNNLIQDISTSLKSIVSPMSSESQTEKETQLTQKFNNTLDSTFTKYNNVLGFGSQYAQAPQNITVTLFGKKYTLIDFSLLDEHVEIIRALFLSLAYLYGFLFFLRGGK